MKKSISVLLSLIMVLSASSLAPVAIPAATGVITAQAATKVKINATKKTLVKGQTYTLKVSGTKKKVKWSTGKKSVATVNSKGKVTAKAKGTATITAKVGSKKYTCKVTVETPKINKTSLTLTETNSYTLKVSGTKQKVTWSSSSKSVATVSSEGVVKAKKAGKATITAKLTGGKKYTCKVTVKAPSVDLKKITVKNYNIVDCGGVVSIVTNKNKTPVKVTVTVLYYDAKGKLIDSKQDVNYCLEPNRSCALNVSAPSDPNTYMFLNYSSYKVKISAEKAENMVCGASKISLDVTDSKSAGRLVIGATNTGSKDLFSVEVAAVFFDKNGRCLGYDYTYPECETAGTTDYVNIDYPSDTAPASYQVYVNSAYSYTWMD